MNSCIGCIYAEWEKTSGGRLHPSGGGRCSYEFVMPDLPAAKYWIGGSPVPAGWRINRKETHKYPCKCYKGDKI